MNPLRPNPTLYFRWTERIDFEGSAVVGTYKDEHTTGIQYVLQQWWTSGKGGGKWKDVPHTPFLGKENIDNPPDQKY